ncbi:hypothetical protein [Sphingomonas sp. PR090111-T3T-6A]|uniref:hypothetical protein n=1 Tax=Sphingomonas sp. PR090111-T3T-6A TaxID=685778 RepID=UPI00037D6E3B|nr:hypothetical protein [Sphingomonas sp. PR090111-T3T-6A]
MPYPILSKAEVRPYLLAEGDNKPSLPTPRLGDEGLDADWESIGAEVGSVLLSLLDKHPVKSKSDGGPFEALAAPEVHKLLPSHPALANAEFWIWLAVTHCEEAIDLRYAGKRNLQNFGVGGAGENWPYRLWVRAEIAFDQNAKDHYALAKLGDIDFWRSHVFRQGYGDVRTFARALLEFQFPAKAKRKPRLKIAQIRDFAKHLKRARSNLMFEVMTEARATQFIESEWERLAQSTE